MLLDGSHPEIVLVWIAVILIGIVGTSISGAAFGPARREQMLDRIRHLIPTTRCWRRSTAHRSAVKMSRTSITCWLLPSAACTSAYADEARCSSTA